MIALTSALIVFTIYSMQPAEQMKIVNNIERTMSRMAHNMEFPPNNIKPELSNTIREYFVSIQLSPLYNIVLLICNFRSILARTSRT